jgi:uncharacterized protein
LVTEVDLTRKRIALSIKQATEAPARKEHTAAPRKDFNKPKEQPKEKPKEKDPANLSMSDALSMLKSKFGK